MTPKAECLPKTSSAICLATSSTALMPKSAVLRTLVDFPSVPGKRQFSPEFPPVTLVTCRRSHVCHPWRTAVEPKLRYFRKASAEAYCGRGRVLIPPLRQMHLPEVEGAIERLEFLEHDHILAGSLHAEAEELGQRYLATGRLEAAGVEAFRKGIASLVSIYKQHIGIEDNLVFPLAARLLSSTDKFAIANEMAARRKLRLVASAKRW